MMPSGQRHSAIQNTRLGTLHKNAMDVGYLCFGRGRGRCGGGSGCCGGADADVVVLVLVLVAVLVVRLLLQTIS